MNLISQKFGKLTVLKKLKKRKYGQIMWLCHCDCGNLKKITTGHLKNKHTRSCGCLHKEIMTTHNMSYSSTYKCWQSLIQRCINSNDNNYYHYGGRGIKVCSRWLNSFENFFTDMGERPKDMQLDRKDNDRNYSKRNCHWTTPKQNSRNKSNNHLLTFNDKTQCMSAWSEELNIPKTTISNRLRRGWSTNETLLGRRNK